MGGDGGFGRKAGSVADFSSRHSEKRVTMVGENPALAFRQGGSSFPAGHPVRQTYLRHLG